MLNVFLSTLLVNCLVAYFMQNVFFRQPEIYECDDSFEEEWEYDEDEESSPMLLPGLLSRTKFRNEYLSDPYAKETCLNLHGKVEVTKAVRNWVQKMCDKNNALGQNTNFFALKMYRLHLFSKAFTFLFP